MNSAIIVKDGRIIDPANKRDELADLDLGGFKDVGATFISLLKERWRQTSRRASSTLILAEQERRRRDMYVAARISNRISSVRSDM